MLLSESSKMSLKKAAPGLERPFLLRANAPPGIVQTVYVSACEPSTWQ